MMKTLARILQRNRNTHTHIYTHAHLDSQTRTHTYVKRLVIRNRLMWFRG